MTDTIATLKQQLLDLTASHTSGGVSDRQYEAQRAALEKSLLEKVMQDGGGASEKTGGGKRGKRAAGASSGGGAAAVAATAQPQAIDRPSGKFVSLLVAGVVVLACAGYLWKGSPQRMGQGPADAAASAAAGGPEHAIGKEEFMVMIDKLANRLKEQPDNAEGWVMLGRSYTVVGQHADALKAYERAVALRPTDAQVLADYADSMAVNNNMSLAGEPMKWVTKALQADQNNLKALALAGTDAFMRKDYAGAVKYWQHLVDVGPPDSDYVREIAGGLKEARALGGLPEGDEPESLDLLQTLDLRTNGFVTVGKLRVPRASPLAVQLADGRVLVAGGESRSLDAWRRTGLPIETWTPATPVAPALPEFDAPRTPQAARLLPDGRVAIAACDRTILWNPATASWGRADDLPAGGAGCRIVARGESFLAITPEGCAYELGGWPR